MIALHVKMYRNGTHDMPVKVARATPMHALRRLCATYWSMDPQRIRLSFDGFVLDDDDTPASLHLKPGFQIDLIEVHLNAV